MNDDDELVPWGHDQPTCSNCNHRVDVGDVIDGSEARCPTCGATLVATAFTRSPGFPLGHFALIAHHVPMAPRPRDRRASRRRWARSGRR